MGMHLNKPYRIIASKEKRYHAHYGFPSAEVVVVPVKELGEEVLCDVRWEDSNGELKVIQNAMFVSDNLIPLNSMIDSKLFEIYTHYYSPLSKNNE